MSLMGLLAYNEGRKASRLGREAAKQDQEGQPKPAVNLTAGQASQDKQMEDPHVQQKSSQKHRRQTLHPRRLRLQLAEKRTLTEAILKGPHMLSAPARHDARPVDEAYMLGFKLEALHQADLAGRERLVPSANPSLFDTDREQFNAKLAAVLATPKSPRLASPDRYTRYSRWGRKPRKGSRKLRDNPGAA